MKSLNLKMAIVAISMTITACGGSGGGSNQSTPSPQPDPGPQYDCTTLAGHYTNDMHAGETLDIANNCTFTDSLCGYTASYEVHDWDTGELTITIHGTNGTPGCMSNTAHDCLFGTTDTQLAVTCDDGAHAFLFTAN